MLPCAHHGTLQTRNTNVVVVGAGAVGLAVAVQLRRANVERVLVIERNSAAGMGSTSRANGGVRTQFATAVNIAFSQYTIAALADLDRASGGLVGYRPIGYLFIAGTDASANELGARVRLQRSLGAPVELIEPSRAASMVPGLRFDGVRSTSFCASDGIIDPHGVVSALCDEGRHLGVRYLFDTAVDEIERHGARIRVHCGALDVECDVVVNAAGPHARELAATAGIDLPVTPRRRNLVCTGPVDSLPDAIPMCVDMDTGVLIRREGSGVLIGYSEPDTAATFDTSFEPAFLDAIASRIGNRFPFLERATIDMRKCWAGLYPETPDQHAIVGAPAAAPWFLQCAGFGGHGIMHSLAAGLAIAEVVRDGRCTTFDITPLHPDRFDGADLRTETAIL